jgi:hypothetical protein
MNFKSFLREEVEVKKYGNDAQEIVGEKISKLYEQYLGDSHKLEK